EDETTAPSSVCSIFASCAAMAARLAEPGARRAPPPPTSDYLKLNRAVWSVPSTSRIWNCRHVPAQLADVFQTYLYWPSWKVRPSSELVGEGEPIGAPGTQVIWTDNGEPAVMIAS